MAATDVAPESVAATPAASAATRPARGFWRQGEPLVWASGAALAAMLLLLAVLLTVVAVNGLGVFWPAAIEEFTLTDGSKLLGRLVRWEVNPDNGVRSIQLKTANREFAPGRQDFCWVEATKVGSTAKPKDVMVLERVENGDFYGFLRELRTPNLAMRPGGDMADQLGAALAEIEVRRRRELGPVVGEIMDLSERLHDLRQSMLRVRYRDSRLAPGPAAEAAHAVAREKLERLEAQDAAVREQSQRLVQQQHTVEADLARNVAVFADGQGQERTIPLASIVRAYEPNAMWLPAKVGHYLSKIVELLTQKPRESNTEGGLFPAIFGTLLLMFLMALSSFPLGVLAGIYLGEYARDGFLVRMVRIAVNNLAGIPSIVYGIFGLGFFVYGAGGLLDNWLYPERVEAGMPTFGTGGILWASLTLGLLTMPVVIVATEEALRAIPRGIHESSLAMGATKFQTLVRVLLPMAAPGILTGFILAMARAAGEVAPLMITGVVKLAPSLALDGQFPFVHLDRKFMHLGFHIYDIGFQSPNVEAAKPMVYVTTLLLVLLVLLMSGTAIMLRNRMRRRLQYRAI